MPSPDRTYPFPKGKELAEKLQAARQRQDQYSNGGDGEIIERVQKASDGIKKSHLDALIARADNAAQAGRDHEHIKWLRKACDTITQPFSAASACKKGCSHCCHIAVAITEPEAQLIAKVSKKKLAQPPRRPPSQVEQNASRFYGSACPFLQNGACSIYDSRPIACRAQLNADVDDLLCQLLDPEQKEMPMVPYVDLRFIKMRTITRLDMRIADIREWFPT